MFCKQDRNLELSKNRRIIIFIIGLVESMLFCGAVFGWPQLVYILKNEGIYSHLCIETELQNGVGYNSSLNSLEFNEFSTHNHTSKNENSLVVKEEWVNPRCENLDSVVNSSDKLRQISPDKVRMKFI